jgi:hypothetical protein
LCFAGSASGGTLGADKWHYFFLFGCKERVFCAKIPIFVQSMRKQVNPKIWQTKKSSSRWSV